MIISMFFKLHLDRHLVISNIFIFISRSIYWLGLGVFMSILTIISNVIFFIILSSCRSLTLEFSGHNPINHFVAHPVQSGLSTDVNSLKNDEFQNCAWLSTAEEVAVDRCTQDLNSQNFSNMTVYASSHSSTV
ncbi:hypothetical protein Taro_034166 [Colocasia esculenta]|uniref:Uncharacterized protein n=1 Tax=Colocasia esculenta TaxID=4460 RepID=A0A843W6T2_COLES|nr:hypothetical protein [Colocasia esculenta]